MAPRDLWASVLRLEERQRQVPDARRDTDVCPLSKGGSIERKCCTCRNSADTLLS